MADTITLANTLGLKIDQQLVGAQVNVPGTLLTSLDYVTQHDTANKTRGANADFHRAFVAGGGGSKHVSFTYTVDDVHAVQILPENWDNWAQGNKTGNDRSVSVELCVNSDADQEKARDNAAKLVASILVANGLDVSRLKQHNFWSGKNCPASIRAEPGAWERFVEMVRGYVEQLHSHEILKVDYDAAETKIKPETIRIKDFSTISPEVFRRVLADAKSPALDEAATLYAICVRHWINPAVALAFFGRESTYATDPNGMVALTHNWGNIIADQNRGTIAHDTYPFGGHQFRVYYTFAEGLEDWCQLWDKPLYQKAGITGGLAAQLRLYDEGTSAAYLDFVIKHVKLWLDQSGNFFYPAAEAA